MVCTQCQHQNPAGARFCNACAAPLDVVCQACGHGNPPRSRFCNGCAASLVSEPSRASEAGFSSPRAYPPQHLAEKILTSRSALEGERKVVTVLFADLKGSMELLADRDPEEARKVLDPVLERMMEAVHHYEGTVNQVMGDGIMALFGAPLAHEDHAVRACYAALRMQELVKRYAEDARHAYGVNVQIRIGLNSGEVVVRAIGSDLHMDYTAVGQTTHLAARMEQFASPGSILLTSATVELVEGFVAVKPLGPLPVKGLADQLDVYEVMGAGPARTRFQAAAARGLARFVGRDTEMEQLRHALDRATAGHGQVAAIVGEAGVGKSRLFYEFTHSHRMQGWLILESGSVSYGKATAYLPVIDLLKGYFKIQDRDDQREIRDKVIGRVLGLDRSLEPLLPPVLALLDVPVEDPGWEALDPPQRRQRTLDAVKRLLLRESQVQPLLLVIEDLHWIDSETQAILDSLVDSLGSIRVLLLVNYRPEYEHRWGKKTYYTQLRLESLPPESTDELLHSLLGDAPGLEPVKQMLRRRGNPFFLEETVRTLVETKALDGERGAYRLVRPVHSLQIPTTVQAILAARIDRLPVEEKQLLQTASVIGKDMPFVLLQAIAELPEEDLRRGLTHLQAAEFLYETSLFHDLEYTFKHALTHEVAYAGLLQDRRRALHARIVEALELLYADRLAEHVERLAHHAWRAEAWDKAVDYLRRAGLKAFNRSANREAATHLEEAIRAVSHLPQTRGNLEQAVDLRLALRPCLVPLGELGRILELAREAEPLVKALEDPRREALIRGHISGPLMQTGHLDEALAHGMQAVALAESLGDPALGIIARYYVGQAQWFRGAHRVALEFCQRDPGLSADELIALGQAQSGPSLFYGATAAYNYFFSLSISSLCLTELGEFDEAFAHSERATRMAKAFEMSYLGSLVDAVVGHVHLRKGALQQAVFLLERCVRSYERADARLTELIMAGMLGPAFTLSGRTADAIALFERARGFADPKGLVSWNTPVLAHLGDAYSRIGRFGEAVETSSRALDLAREHGMRGYEAWASYALGEIYSRATPLEAEQSHDAYEQGRSLAHELEMRPLVAHCHLGLGKLYRCTGRREKAQEHLATATTLYREMDMRFWLGQADAELRQLT